MTPKTWKGVERRVAKYLGTSRNPLSGGNSKHTRSDSLHPTIFVETKHGQGCPNSWGGILTLFEKVERLAQDEAKVPLLVLHRKGGSRVEEYDAYVRFPRNVGIIVCVPLAAARGILVPGSK